MISILTVSDAVSRDLYPTFDAAGCVKVSLVLGCGDLPPEYLAYLAQATRAPLYYVRGNHDLRYRAQPPPGCIDLHARLITFKGLNLLGLEGSMWYNGGPQQYTEGEMRGIIRRLRPAIRGRGGIDVVFTHAPPSGVYADTDLCHRGFECFRWLIDKYRPRYFVHGHIHRTFSDSAERVTVLGATRVVNTFGHHLLEIENPQDH